MEYRNNNSVYIRVMYGPYPTVLYPPRMLSERHTHTHTHARALARTHAHAHTHTALRYIYVYICINIYIYFSIVVTSPLWKIWHYCNFAPPHCRRWLWNQYCEAWSDLAPTLPPPAVLSAISACSRRVCRPYRSGVWGWQVGRLPQAPLLRGSRASGLRASLWVCQAIFSDKLEMLIHAPFQILLQGQIT